jgi:hypothetical protein
MGAPPPPRNLLSANPEPDARRPRRARAPQRCLQEGNDESAATARFSRTRVFTRSQAVGETTPRRRPQGGCGALERHHRRHRHRSGRAFTRRYLHTTPCPPSPRQERGIQIWIWAERMKKTPPAKTSLRCTPRRPNDQGAPPTPPPRSSPEGRPRVHHPGPPPRRPNPQPRKAAGIHLVAAVMVRRAACR